MSERGSEPARLSAERLAEIREVAKMGGWDGDPRAIALTECIRDLLQAHDELQKALTRVVPWLDYEDFPAILEGLSDTEAKAFIEDAQAARAALKEALT